MWRSTLGGNLIQSVKRGAQREKDYRVKCLCNQTVLPAQTAHAKFKAAGIKVATVGPGAVHREDHQG